MADRIVRDFTSFDEEAKGILQLISQLHTSRVSGYGFTAEADLLGVEKYAINEQLDNRICPVCRVMHGRTFEVSTARALYDSILLEDDPEKIKALQPWPSQKASNVKIMQLMSADELVRQGWHAPPFHPWCRGLLVHVDDVPNIGSTPSYQALPPEPASIFLGRPVVASDFSEMTRNSRIDFSNMGSHTAEVWNNVFGDLNPTEFFRIWDNGTDNMLSLNGGSMRIGGYSGTDVKGILSIRTKVFDEVGDQMAAIDRTFRKYHDDTLIADHAYFNINREFQGKGFAKKFMAESVNLYEKIGVSQIEMGANIDIGSYAWAKYGFQPITLSQAGRLADSIGERLNNLISRGLDDEVVDAIQTILENLRTDPEAIWTLADISMQYHGSGVGVQLLAGNSYDAILSLGDDVAMARFWEYVGRPI
jgi:GNAT superfamily N-acetyltransferase